MGVIRIPDKKEFRGIYPGEYFGNMWLTKNIDLRRNQGKLTLGDSFTSKFDSGDDADLTTPVAFLRTAADGTDRWWVNGGKLFKTTNTDPETGWTQDAIASSPTAPLWDMLEFVDALLVPTDTDIARLASGTWTASWWSSLTGASALITSVPHRMCEFAGAVLITDGRFINTYDGILATDPDLTLPSQFEAQWVIPTDDYVFIGTKSLDGSQAEVFFWDRTSDVFNARYPIGDSEALAGFAIDGIPHIVTKRGAIKRFTGKGFRTVAQFPTLEAKVNITGLHPNGVIVDENVVLLNMNFGATTTTRALSGIWLYDADTRNLVHTGSVRNDSGNDYSQQVVSATGAMKATSPSQGLMLVGATAYTNYTGGTKAGVFTADEEATVNRGYVITPKLSAPSVKAMWKKLFTKFRTLQDATDRIRILYRDKESTTLPAYETITWVTATTFTGSNANVAVGDFVEILGGDNAGALAKITAIAAGSPKTFTIDLTLNATTNSAYARYLNFKDLGTISKQGIQEQSFDVLRRAQWIQFLIELRGTERSPELEELLLTFDDVNATGNT